MRCTSWRARGVFTGSFLHLTRSRGNRQIGSCENRFFQFPKGHYMFLQLDGVGARYLQLARALKQAILDGRCAPASRLPATRVFARELDLSRNTVLAAYEQLGAEGFIEGRIGSGCYVAAFAA